jgi:hypothetical protein
MWLGEAPIGARLIKLLVRAHRFNTTLKATASPLLRLLGAKE